LLTGEYTNNQIISAFKKAALRLELDGPWALMSKAGLKLSDLTADREAIYTGPAIERLEHLTYAEKELLKEELAALLEAADLSRRATNEQIINAFKNAELRLTGSNHWLLMSKAGVNLTHLHRNRPQPYTGPSIERLPRLTRAEKRQIKQELAALIGVIDESAVPFALAAAVEASPAGFLRTRSDLVALPLALPRAERILLSSLSDPLEKRVARVWNWYGWFLLTLAEILDLEPGVAAAVLAVQVNQRGLSQDGRMRIRFENHIFFEKWGRQHPERFRQHFRFDPRRPQQRHLWRPEQGQTWRYCRGSQAREWAVFDFARSLDDTAAKLSLAMGAVRLMGFNYAAIGQMSVEQMYRDFSASENQQLLGLFDLIGGPTRSSRQLLALQNQDFDTFAGLYCGPAQVSHYASAFHDALAAFQRLTVPSVPL
jgi:hypothetical protein